MLGRLSFGLGLFVGSMSAGYVLGRLGRVTEPQANRIVQFVVKRLSPIVLCLSFWRLRLDTHQPFLLPLIGGLTALSTLLPAWLYARAAKLSAPQTGSFLTCAMFSNLGFLGAFIAFALFGETAYSLAMVHLLFFSPCFYLIGFTLAKRYGSRISASSASPFSNELRFYPFAGLLLGLCFSLLHVPRPAIFESINHILIPVDTALYLAAIGSQLHVASLRQWIRPCVAMSAIKFLYTPLIGWALASWWQLTGLPRFIVLLQSAMPVAISPLMLPLLFGLERRLSSSLWLVTTCLAVAWLPLYLWFIRGGF